MNNQSTKLAMRGTLLSIFIYILIASMKIIIGTLWQSSALSADGWNNFTDVLSSIAIFIGIRASTIPADSDHQYGHWKIESISGLISSFIMFTIGTQVLITACLSFFQSESKTFDWLLVLTGLASSLIVGCTFLCNNYLANKTQSVGLRATAQNNLSDAITSFITAISLLVVMLTQWLWIDSIMALIVAFVILKTAYTIFKDNAFILSDGFDVERLENYRQVISSHPEILSIRLLKARHYGANIYIDTTVIMPATLTVKESHDVTEHIEKLLRDELHVQYIDIHVEPSED